MNLKTLSLTTALVFSATAAMASFQTQDVNGDGQLSKDEYYGSVSDAGVYADWDKNSDGLLDETEFTAVNADWVFTTYDVSADGYVDAGELYDGYYASYDSTEDGHWDNGEWDDAGEAGLFDW